MSTTRTAETLYPHPEEASERIVVFLRAKELAERWRTSVGSLAQMRYRGVGPAYINIPGVGIRYAIDVIEAYERAGQ